MVKMISSPRNPERRSYLVNKSPAWLHLNGSGPFSKAIRHHGELCCKLLLLSFLSGETNQSDETFPTEHPRRLLLKLTKNSIKSQTWNTRVLLSNVKTPSLVIEELIMFQSCNNWFIFHLFGIGLYLLKGEWNSLMKAVVKLKLSTYIDPWYFESH